MKLRSCLLALPAAALAMASSAQEAAQCNGILLTDIATEAGISFQHDRGETGIYQLPETLGAGTAWIDYDDDGWFDLYMVQSGTFPPDYGEASANRLYRNQGDGTFVDVTEATGTGDRAYGMAVNVSDVDGNGYPDLYLVNYGPDRLYLNQGDGTFVDATEQSGLGLDGWSTAAAFNDADLDGDLDLYVVRYLKYDPADPVVCRDSVNDMQDYCHPNLYLGGEDRFFRNLGDARFEDATDEVGLGQAHGKGLGVMFSDLDGDRYPDIYVANDSTVNFMFHNRGDGTFDDVGLLSGTAVSREGLPQAGMGVALGDIDGDLDPDLAVTNLDTETNALYVNQGMMMFEEASASNGFGIPSFNVLGFGIILADLDLDGDLDAYIANGNVRHNPSREGITHAMPDLLLVGDGTGDFVEIDCGPALDGIYVGRGLATGDFDNDGDVDLALSNSGGPQQLIRNDLPSRPWLGVEVRGRAPNTFAVGASVTLTTQQGSQVKWRTGGDSYVSTSDPRMIFGWAEGDEPVELTIVWPSGETTTRALTPDDVGEYLRIDEP
jgi:hypothetical protein